MPRLRVALLAPAYAAAAALTVNGARLRWRLRLLWRRLRRTNTTIDMATRIPLYERIWKEAARTIGARFHEIQTGLWRIEQGGRSTVIANYVVQLDDPVVLRVAGDKALCHRLLDRHALPIPEHEVYTLASLDAAARFMARHPDSCFVVKPSSGTSGARGVTTHIRGVRECRSASALASLYGEPLLIERWIPGESYRLLFLDGEMIHASRRRGIRISGDGRSTIGDLLRARGLAEPAGASGTLTSRDVDGTLRAQRLSVRSILEPGREVVVASAGAGVTKNAEIRTIFDEDATALIGPELREQARRAVEALGSSFAGVDVITLDPALPLEATGGAINEINTTPGLHHHYGLAGGRDGAAAAVRVLARLLRADFNTGYAAPRPGVTLTVQEAAPSR